jgi:hypothetical protein
MFDLIIGDPFSFSFWEAHACQTFGEPAPQVKQS